MTSLTCLKIEKWLSYLLKVTKNDLWYSWLSVACLDEKVRSDSLIWLNLCLLKWVPKSPDFDSTNSPKVAIYPEARY